MIIMMQLDEPNQRNCIYKLKKTEQKAGASTRQIKVIEKYF